MFVYFNKEGVIKEIINDSSIRQGNANVNTVYFFIEGADPQTATDSNGMYYKALYFSLGRYTMYLLDEHGEPLPSIEGISFDITTVKIEVPYDKKKELKFFKYFTRYEMFQLPIPQEVLNYKGTVGLKFQMVNNDAIDTQGLIVFNIEGTSPDLEIAPDTAITIAEWNYLLANMLTPEDVYTKAEANSAFQEKLIAGENITIENNVISATGGAGGRAEWGSITGNIEDQTDLQTELSGKQDILTFDNTPTSDSSNPVTSDGIFDALQDVREVAEGKCQTFILSYTDTLIVVKNEVQSDLNKKIFNGSGADITQAVLNGDYDNQTFGNANFNSQANQIFCFQSPYSTYLIVRVNGGYMFLQYSDVINRKKGDIYLVIQTDVPDRWYGDDYTFYKLETSKVDLTNYVTLDGAQTITGEKTFRDLALSASDSYDANKWYIRGWGASGLDIGLRGENKGIKIQEGSVSPLTTGVTDLGSSSAAWKRLFLSNNKEGACFLTTISTYYSLYTDTNNNLNLALPSGTVAERIDLDGNFISMNGKDLGESSHKWKDLYLNGKAIFSAGSNTFTIGGNDYNGLDIARSGTTVMSFGGSDFSTYTHQPFSNNTYDLGSSSRAWKDLYLTGELRLATSGSYQWLLKSDGINIYIGSYLNGTTYDNSYLIKPLYLSPKYNGTNSLGESTRTWKDLYLSGKVDFGNDAYITKDQYNRITLNVSDNAKIVVDAGQTYINNNLLPLTATRDLGSDDYKWQNLYLSGNLTDGTNTVTVAQLASGIGGTYRHVIYIEGATADMNIAVNLNTATPITTQAALAAINENVMGGTATLDEQSRYKIVAIDSVGTVGSITYLDETGQHTLNIVDIYQDVVNQL